MHAETSPSTRRRRRKTSRHQQARASSPTAARPRPPPHAARRPAGPAAALPFSPARQRVSVTAARVSRALRAVAPPSLTRCTRIPVPGDEADAVLSSSGSDDDGFGRGRGSEPRRGRDDAGGDGRKRACGDDPHGAGEDEPSQPTASQQAACEMNARHLQRRRHEQRWAASGDDGDLPPPVLFSYVVELYGSRRFAHLDAAYRDYYEQQSSDRSDPLLSFIVRSERKRYRIVTAGREFITISFQMSELISCLTLDPIRCAPCVKSSLDPGGIQRTKSNLSPERVHR